VVSYVEPSSLFSASGGICAFCSAYIKKPDYLRDSADEAKGHRTP